MERSDIDRSEHDVPRRGVSRGGHQTVAQIRENPFLRYFLDLHEYLREDRFDPFMLVHFRKRISSTPFKRINHAIIRGARQQ